MAERGERAKPGDKESGRGRKPLSRLTLSDIGVSKTQSSRWQSLAALGPREFEIHVTSAKKTAANGFNSGAYNGTKFSGEFERYTPKPYLELVRRVLGHIDLDPASAKAAQRNVRATRYFTIVEDGLKQNWSGRVFLNPPYHWDLVGPFVDKLVEEYTSGRVKGAILPINTTTDTQYFDAVARTCSSICFTQGRIQFLLPNGQQIDAPPIIGQMFAYFGRAVDKFERVILRDWAVRASEPIIHSVSPGDAKCCCFTR
jgi:hypothetical protein